MSLLLNIIFCITFEPFFTSVDNFKDVSYVKSRRNENDTQRNGRIPLTEPTRENLVKYEVNSQYPKILPSDQPNYLQES